MTPASTISRGQADAMLRRFALLLVLAAMFWAAVLYPFRLPNEILTRLETWAEGAGLLGHLFRTQLRSQLAFNHSPLVYKEDVAQGLLLGALLLLAIVQLRATMRPAAKPARLFSLSNPALYFFLVLIYLIPGIYFSPTPNMSLRTFIAFATGLVAAAAVIGAPDARATSQKIRALLLIAGVIVGAVSVLQHVGLADKWFMPHWEDPRNRVGSFIGHNTGLSSFLLFPLFFGLQGLFDGGRRLTSRTLHGAVAGLCAFVIVAAQSRAIWGICVLLLPAYLWFHAFGQGRARGIRLILVVVLGVSVVVASQSLFPSVNPFARHAVPLVERVKRGFSLEQMLAETRLRIVVCSLPLVAEKPIFGHGIGTFQWVYPPAQGKYFWENRDTLLVPTGKRTDLAHNDYLQWLVETGALGCLLLGAALWLVLRRGARVMGSLPAGQPRAYLASFAYPMAGVALQALVDFPFHIVPIALAWIACAAVWYRAGEVVGIMPLAESPPDEPLPMALPRGGEIQISYRKVAGLVGLLGAAAVVPTTGVFVLRDYIADIWQVDGNNWVTTYRSLGDNQERAQYYLLGEARRYFRTAERVNPFNGQAYEGSAFAFLGLAKLDFKNWKEAQARGDSEGARVFQSSAIGHYENAIQKAIAQIQHAELRYHFTYYTIGTAYYSLFMIKAVPNYLESARTALTEAVRMNIADTSSLFELARAHEESPNPNPELAAQCRRIIWETNPAFAAQLYILPVLEFASLGEHGAAEGTFARIAAEAPDEWRVTQARADLYLRQATWPPPEVDRDTSVPLTETDWFKSRIALAETLQRETEVLQPDDPTVLYLRMLLESAKGNYRAALGIADKLAPRLRRDEDLMVLRWMLASRLGEERPLPPEYLKQGEFSRRRNRYRLLYFGEQQTGARQLATMAGTPGAYVDQPSLLRAAAWLKANGEHEAVLKIARYLRQHHPASAAARKLFEPLAPELDAIDAAHSVEDGDALTTAP